MLAEDDCRSILDVELETLHSIYVNELVIEHDDQQKPCCVSIQLHPSTADNVDEQYVRMTLIFQLSPEYPDDVPEIIIRNPRGLSDQKINGITENLLSIAEGRKGGSMLFELIEAAKEDLTAENIPSEECAICLYGFTDEDVFTKTECYHYFHSHCLARYVQNKLSEEEEGNSNKVKVEPENQHVEKNIVCPVCRVSITFPSFHEQFPTPIAVTEAELDLDQVAIQRQKEMSHLYQKQLACGGIIDIEAEKNKFVLEISSEVPRKSTEESPDISKLAISESKAKAADIPVRAKVGDSPINSSREQDNSIKKSFLQDNEKQRSSNYRKQGRYSKRDNTYEESRRTRGSGNYNKGNQRGGRFYSNYQRERRYRESPDKDDGCDATKDLSSSHDDNVEGRSRNKQFSQHSRSPSPDAAMEKSENYSSKDSRGDHAYSERQGFDGRFRGNRPYRAYGYRGYQRPQNSYNRRYMQRNRYVPRHDKEHHDSNEEDSAEASENYSSRREESSLSSDRKFSQNTSARGRYSENNRYSESRRYPHERTYNDRSSRYSNSRYPSDAQSRYNYRGRDYNQKNYGSKFSSKPAHRGRSDTHSNNESLHTSYEEEHSKNNRSQESQSNAKNQYSPPTELHDRQTKSTDCTTDTSTTNNETSSYDKSEKTVIKETDVSAKDVSINNEECNIIPFLSSANKCNGAIVRPPPGFTDPTKQVIYGLPSANPPPPGFYRS